MANNKGKCQVCAAISESFCSWCKMVFYCSREHQKQDWASHKETCTKKKYRMEEDGKLGRHLVASEDIKPDHILFKDKPLVLSYKLDTLEYTGYKICLGCYKEIPSVVERTKGDRGKGGEAYYKKGKDEDRKAQMKRAAAVASLLEKVVAVDKERKQAAAAVSSSSSGGGGETKKMESSLLLPLQSGNNEQADDDDDDHEDTHEQRENDDGGDDQADDNNDEDSSSVDKNESDEYGDNSNEDEDNDDDDSSSGGEEEEEKVCLSCHLPICSTLCSTQYFHKNFECKLVREAHYHQQQQLLQNTADIGPAALSSSASAASSSPEEESMGISGEGKQRSNKEPMSLGTTCKNTGRSCSKRNMITSLRNGIRETLLRNLLYLRCLLLKHVNEGHWNQLISLRSNEETRKGDVSSLEKSTGVFTTLKKILTEINHPTLTSRQLVYKPDIHKLVGIIEINGLTMSVSQNVEVTGIYPTFSLMEHSCIPSVKYYLVPCSSSSSSSKGSSSGENCSYKKTSTFFELYCRSAIKLKMGDHLAVSHTNAMWNTDKRREFLKKEKHFWCECSRCMDKFELGSNFSTILCPLPGCEGGCVPVPTANSNEFQWKCTSAKCGKVCAAWQVKILDTKLCEMVGRSKPSIESYKECLAKMGELVHPDYYLCCIVTHSLIQMCGHDADSVHDTELLKEKITLCNKLLNVIKKLDPGLANLNIYASIVFYEIQNAILALAGAEVDDDFHILRSNPERVNLAKVYLQKCIDCFKYEFLDLPESKLKILAMKKMEYLNTVMNKR